MDTLTLKSYGKINLALEVTSKRSDGYHNLFSVMQTIELHDKITFVESSKIVVILLVVSLPASSKLVVVLS